MCGWGGWILIVNDDHFIYNIQIIFSPENPIKINPQNFTTKVEENSAAARVLPPRTAGSGPNQAIRKMK